MSFQNILLVDDDNLLHVMIKKLLEKFNFNLYYADSVKKAEGLVDTYHFDIAVLDVLLPDGIGLQVCKHLHKYSPQAKVLLITGQSYSITQHPILSYQIDDIMFKPFVPVVLVSKILSLARMRYKILDDSMEVIVDDVSIDFSALTAKKGDIIIKLGSREARILKVLISKANKIVSRDILKKAAFGKRNVNEGSLTVLIQRLRVKLRKLQIGQLVSVWGQGYKLVLNGPVTMSPSFSNASNF